MTGAGGCGRVPTGADRCRQVRADADGCGRTLLIVVLVVLVAGCSGPADPPPAPAQTNEAPKDAQHAGITEPHGDHTPHHGGIVLMNGDVHYEVVMDPAGRYEVWFSDAVRTDLPASVAANARVEVARPGSAVESLPLAIDEAGESWVGTGQPVTGDGVMLKVTYALKGIPSEVEIPFVAPKR
jgi:hypothetical protein